MSWTFLTNNNDEREAMDIGITTKKLQLDPSIDTLPYRKYGNAWVCMWGSAYANGGCDETDELGVRSINHNTNKRLSSHQFFYPIEHFQHNLFIPHVFCCVTQFKHPFQNVLQ